MDEKLEAKFNRAYSDYSQMLFNIAFTYLLSKSLAEDVIQDVFLTFLKKDLALENDDLKYYLIRLTINRSIDETRKHKKEIALDESIINSYSIDEKNSNGEVLEAINKLDEKYKSIVLLYYYEDYSIEMISKALKINANTCYFRLNKAKEILREILGDYENG